jgi:hypothetical protein
MMHTRNGSYNMRGMGDVTLPSLDQLLQSAQNAITGQIAHAVVTSPDVQKAAGQGAATAFGTKFYTFVTTYKKPLMYAGIAGLVGIGILIASKSMRKTA